MIPRRFGLAVALACWAAAAPAPGAARDWVAQAFPANPPLPPVVGTPGAAAPGSAAPGAAAPPLHGAEDGLPPYEPQLERLAERLGTLALLRGLCGEGDAADYRDRMAALIAVEAQTDLRRARLAGAFNRGLRGYGATYRSCTASARLVIDRALADADRLTRDLATRYGGS